MVTGHALLLKGRYLPPGDIITVLVTYEPWFPPGTLCSSPQRFRHQFPIHMSPLLLTRTCHMMKGNGEKDGPQKEGRGRGLMWSSCGSGLNLSSRILGCILAPCSQGSPSSSVHLAVPPPRYHLQCQESKMTLPLPPCLHHNCPGGL